MCHASQKFQFPEDPLQLGRHGFHKRFRHLLRRPLPLTQHPADRHVDRPLTVHFQKKFQTVIQLFPGLPFYPFCIELQNQVKIMVPQTVLLVCFKGGPKKSFSSWI